MQVEWFKNPAVGGKSMYLVREYVRAVGHPAQSPSSPASSTALMNPGEGL